MKLLKAVFVAFLGATLAGCGSFSLLHGLQHKVIADPHFEPSSLQVFLAAADNAATQLPLAEGPADWQSQCDRVKQLGERLADEPLTDAQRKECDGIGEQMEMGKLALQMKRVDAKTGLKQSKLVSANITSRVKKIKSLADSKPKT
jgi:hypothetical protein